MISGDKQMATKQISDAAFSALRESFLANFDIDSDACAKAKTRFQFLSLLIAEKVLSQMGDTGSVSYVRGKVTQTDINRSIDVIFDYMSDYNASLLKRKVAIFKDIFRKQVKKIMDEWKVGFNVHFGVSSKRKDKSREHRGN